MIYLRAILGLLALILTVTPVKAADIVLSADIPDEFEFGYYIRINGEEILGHKIQCRHKSIRSVDIEGNVEIRKKIKSCSAGYWSSRNELPVVNGCHWGFRTPYITTWHQNFGDLRAKEVSTDGIPDDLLQLDFKDGALSPQFVPIEMVTPLDDSMELIEMSRWNKDWEKEKHPARLRVTYERLARDADQERGIIVNTIGRGSRDGEDCTVDVEFEFLILKN